MPALKTNIMKPTLKTLSAGALVLAALEQARAQYAPPPPPAPFQGFINEFFRAQDPYMNLWDVGGNFRVRGAKIDNDYYLTRPRLHVGYTDKWWGAYAE